jgi:hypothetical protein
LDTNAFFVPSLVEWDTVYRCLGDVSTDRKFPTLQVITNVVCAKRTSTFSGIPTGLKSCIRLLQGDLLLIDIWMHHLILQQIEKSGCRWMATKVRMLDAVSRSATPLGSIEMLTPPKPINAIYRYDCVPALLDDYHGCRHCTLTNPFDVDDEVNEADDTDDDDAISTRNENPIRCYNLFGSKSLFLGEMLLSSGGLYIGIEQRCCAAGRHN